MPLLPSLDRQLESARAESGDAFLVSHIDTCLSCYLQDHHNRDGELLLGVDVDGTTTVKEVLDGLLDEFRQVGFDLGESRRGYNHDLAKNAIKNLILENEENWDKLFDASLEVPGEDDEDFDEPCQAWFLIHWDVPDEEED